MTVLEASGTVSYSHGWSLDLGRLMLKTVSIRFSERLRLVSWRFGLASVSVKHGEFFLKTEKRIVMNIVQCYAPENDTGDQINEDLYNQFHPIIQSHTENYADGRPEL